MREFSSFSLSLLHKGTKSSWENKVWEMGVFVGNLPESSDEQKKWWETVAKGLSKRASAISNLFHYWLLYGLEAGEKSMRVYQMLGINTKNLPASPCVFYRLKGYSLNTSGKSFTPTLVTLSTSASHITQK